MQKFLSYNLYVKVNTMSSSIKSCKKYLLSYQDTLNNTHQLGIYALDAYDCLMLAKQLNSFIKDHPNSVTRIQQKF